MAGFRDRAKQHFPLNNIQSLVDLFRDELDERCEPNLALLSIVLGVVENALTVNRAWPEPVEDVNRTELIFPDVQLSTVEALYERFVTHVKAHVDLTRFNSDFATRDLVKKVSDVIWNSLSNTYPKDRAHLQSLYSFLTGNKLDCFGVALSVVAACQVLDFKDVQLALSEDHAWVVYGKDSQETAEVTWHGKGNEDKRGQPVNIGVMEKSWLYLNGHSVVCAYPTSVAAMVSSINPAISSTADSVELATLQQKLLWLLYDLGHLEKYPMALGNLGDLEEISPTPNRPSSISLFQKAIKSAKQYYDNMHVYPYTYLGGFCHRKGWYKEALYNWAEAAQVISRYNYNREDEEIYKEFLEIANEVIPRMMKDSGDMQSLSHSNNNSESGKDPPLLQDPECYKLLLKLYDGICQWEEDSSTPVLHVGWAKHLVFSLTKFDSKVRKDLDVHAEGVEEDEDGEGKDSEDAPHEPKRKQWPKRRDSLLAELKRLGEQGEVKKRGPGRPPKKKPVPEMASKVEADSKPGVESAVNGRSKVSSKSQDLSTENEDQIKCTIQELASKVGEESHDDTPNPNMVALAQACGESILNPDYLLGGGEPFTTSSSSGATTTSTATMSTGAVDYSEFLSSRSNGTSFPGLTLDSVLRAESPAGSSCPSGPGGQLPDLASLHSSRCSSRQGPPELAAPAPTGLMLRSAKMKGLKDLLLAEKLNSSAIKLQLTAQSQVSLKHSKVLSEYDFGLPRKRSRRE